MESWTKVLPEYRVQRWDETNSPMRFPYLKTAAQAGKWANMSNFVRLYALFSCGGVYLDTDIEVLRRFDDLLAAPAFLGCEAKDPRVNNAVFGAEPGHPFLLRMMAALLSSFSGQEFANESSPILTTQVLAEEGFKNYSEVPQMVGDLMVYPKRYFYPYFFEEKFHPDCITRDTYTIHRWELSWKKT